MNKDKLNKKIEESAIDILDRLYLEAENKDEIDYWRPLSKIILESIELRDYKGLSQTDLAKLMKTKQSVISRFENMGRIPSYDFIARLALSLGHSPGITLYGDYMAIVPFEKQSFIKHLADQENISTKRIVQNILNESIENRKYNYNIDTNFITNVEFATAAVFYEYCYSDEYHYEKQKNILEKTKAEINLAS